MPQAIEERFASYAAKEPPPTQAGRVALGLTIVNDVQPEIFLRWITLLRSHWWPGPTYHARDMYVTQARNLVLHDALKESESWEALLFWDQDQLPPLLVPGPLSWQASNGEFWQGGFFTEYVQWLIKAEPHKKVIAGLYSSKQDDWELTNDDPPKIIMGPHDPVAYTEENGGYHHLAEPEYLPMLMKRGLYQVDGAGTGSMLIRREIVERMRELKGGDIFEAPPSRGVADQIPGTQWTEDLYFCDQVRKELHETIWLDTAMESGHFQRKLRTAQDYLQAHGYTTTPHEQTSRALIEQARMARAEEKRERKAQGRIWTPPGR